MNQENQPDFLHELLFGEKIKNITACIYHEKYISRQQMLLRITQFAKAITILTEEHNIIGILMQRTPDMICILLGSVYAGRTFLPLDYDLPLSRLEYIINNSGCNIIITDCKNPNAIPGNAVLDVITVEDLYNYNYDVMEIPMVTEEKIAYLIYTSGSTGRPKGVMVSRKSMAAFLRNISRQIEWSDTKRMLALTAITFDIFIMEVFFPFIQDITIVLADDTTIGNPRKIIFELLKQKVDTIQMTPSRLKIVIESSKEMQWLMQLKRIFVGGEDFPLSLLAILQKYSKAKIYNMYGPTEATVWCMVADLTNQSQISLGKPLGDTKIFLEKATGNERLYKLYISGEQLALGYWQNIEETNNKFTHLIDNQTYWYDTGDYVEKSPVQDTIVYKGRQDEQIKLNGYRIELQEIEYCLEKHKKINSAVVFIFEGKNENSFLVAAYISTYELDKNELRTFLLKYLPQYMLPTCFFRLPDFVYTSNHKVNRKKTKEVLINLMK